MKVDDLEGALLDYWVAKAVGTYVATIKNDYGPSVCCIQSPSFPEPHVFAASTNWEIGGTIIESAGISIVLGNEWQASNCWVCFRDGEARKSNGHFLLEGSTPLIAAMRCYVTMKFGEEVEEVT